MKSNRKIILPILIIITMAFPAAKIIDRINGEKIRSFYETEIENIISEYEGPIHSSLGSQSHEFYESVVSPGSSYWKARFIRNNRCRLIEELIDSKIGIDPRRVRYYLHKRYFAELLCGLDNPRRHVDSIKAPIKVSRKFYNNHIDKLASRLLFLADLTKDSKSDQIRRKADLSIRKAMFLKKNTERLAGEMAAIKIGRQCGDIEKYLHEKFKETFNKDDFVVDSGLGKNFP